MPTAIVIGGGIGGLMAARVLSEHFDTVHLVERDVPPRQPAPRKHVPQGYQVHVLLAEGYRLFQQWFPDFDERMDALGIPESDFGTHGIQFLGSMPMPRERTGIAMRCASRPILEGAIRRAVADHTDTVFHEGVKVEGWLMEGDDIAGVRLEGPDGPSVLRGDLVVDAAGRGTATPRWLAEHGFGAPDETKVDAGFAYATARFRPADPSCYEGATFLVCHAQPPDHPLMGALIPDPDGTVLACLIGAPGHHPPVDPEDFVAWTNRLASPVIHDVVVDAEMIEAPRPYRNTANVQRHYERMARWPGRFVALGDSALCLNPRFGQGMTVAAMGASSLHGYLSRHGLQALARDPQGFCLRFQKHLRKATQVPWMMATADDLAWIPDARPALKDRVAGWYFKHLLDLAFRDAGIHVRFMRVAQLLDPPTALFAPDIVVRVLARGLFSRPAPAIAAAPA